MNGTKRRDNKPWTVAELTFMRANASKGRKWIAAQLGRTESSVRRAAERNHISLRSEGEQRGSILGLPRHMRLAELRAIGISHPERLSELNLTNAHQALLDRAAGKRQPICPACTVRPVQTTNGGCIPCWNSALEAEHRDETDRIKARRALDAARQEKRRARR